MGTSGFEALAYGYACGIGEPEGYVVRLVVASRKPLEKVDGDRDNGVDAAEKSGGENFEGKASGKVSVDVGTSVVFGSLDESGVGGVFLVIEV